MKFIAPITCLTLGIAIGWFAKTVPSTSGTAAVASATSSAGMTSDAEKSKLETTSENKPASRARPALDSSKQESEEKVSEGTKAMQKQVAKQMTDVQRKKFETRFSKLCTELSLTADQQVKIRATMEERLTNLGELFSGASSGEDPSKMKDLADMMKTDGLNEAVTSASLTGDQQASFEAVKSKDRQNRIDSKALKDLGNLGSVLDLTQEQKDTVYGVLTEQAAKQEDAKKSFGMMGMFSEGMGIQIDDELGMSEIMQQQMDNHGDVHTNVDIKTFAAETLKKRTEEKIEALRPVLTEQQLQQYRSHLETKASSMLNMFGVVKAPEK
jgi:hypothetical protein